MQKTVSRKQNRGGLSTVHSVRSTGDIGRLFGILFLLGSLVVVGGAQNSMYIPSTPVGPTFGFVGIEYDYTIVTMNPDSFWMFDWGDGTNTSWLQLEDTANSIVQRHQWSQAGLYQLHVKYKGETAPYGVWSDSMLVEIVDYSFADYPSKPKIQTGKILGIVGEVYTYSAVSSDPNGFSVSYRFDFNNGTLSPWTPFVPSNTSSYMTCTWQEPGKYYLRTQARNQYGLVSEWSNPFQVSIKKASDDDGTSIDFLVINDINFQILFSSPQHGTLYNPSTGYSNDIKWNGGGVFLLDDDSDGRWEYIYLPSSGQVQPYTEPVFIDESLFSKIPWTFIIIIVSIILGVLGVVLVLIKTGYIYLYEEEIIVDE